MIPFRYHTPPRFVYHGGEGGGGEYIDPRQGVYDCE